MITQVATTANENKTRQVQTALRELLATVLQKGFYGTAGIELAVQDGTIQSIRSRTERIER
jgi:hypothetical protein